VQYGHFRTSAVALRRSCYRHESQAKEKQGHLEEKYVKIIIIVKGAEGVKWIDFSKNPLEW
jgi:hypothetical protein